MLTNCIFHWRNRNIGTVQPSLYFGDTRNIERTAYFIGETGKWGRFNPDRILVIQETLENMDVEVLWCKHNENQEPINVCYNIDDEFISYENSNQITMNILRIEMEIAQQTDIRQRKLSKLDRNWTPWLCNAIGHAISQQSVRIHSVLSDNKPGFLLGNLENWSRHFLNILIRRIWMTGPVFYFDLRMWVWKVKVKCIKGCWSSLGKKGGLIKKWG